jgi:hypothetical protein
VDRDEISFCNTDAADERDDAVQPDHALVETFSDAAATNF